MWTTANRPKYNRDKLRYPSDLTGEEWAHIEALIPAATEWNGELLAEKKTTTPPIY